jgi:nucleoside-diphosphate-sugar epimerase
MIAVTGANGFIGSQLLQGLARQGSEAVGLTRTNRGGAFRVLSEWSEPALRAALDGVSAVIHTASVVHKPGTVLSEYERFNREGTYALAAAASAVGVRHLIFLSTIKVYGEQNLECADEQTPPRPQDPYAATKWAAEQIVLDMARRGGPLGTVLRLAPVYGRGDKGNVRRVISAIARNRFCLPGDGSTRKSLVHISTVVEVVRAVLAQGAPGIFVVADREAPTMRELADAAARALGKRRPLSIPAALLQALALPVELAFHLAGRPPPAVGELIRKSLVPTVCSPRKVETDLKVACHVDLATALADEVAWMRESGLV